MKKYVVTLEIISEVPPDWIVPSIEVQLNDNEEIKYFDYTTEEV